MNKYLVGWKREDGTFKSFMSVHADDEEGAVQEAEYQLKRPGRISIYKSWKERGSQVQIN